MTHRSDGRTHAAGSQIMTWNDFKCTIPFVSSNHKSTAGLLVIRFVVTTVLVWVMTMYLDQYFYVGGGWFGYVIVAALLTLLNFLLRPILNVVLLPLKLIATLIAIILANALFVWIVREISLKFDPSVVTLDLKGYTGRAMAGVVFGIANWIVTH